jgi:hypothetical protein
VWDSEDDFWLRNVLERSGYKCWQLFNSNPFPSVHVLNHLLYYWYIYVDPKPLIDLSKPLAECDMFCSVVHSHPHFIDVNKRLISCEDSAAEN